MVKFGRKFFFDNAYIKKNRNLTIVIILIVASLVVTTFFITSQFYNKNTDNIEGKVETYKTKEINLFENIPYMLSYFKRLENVRLSDIQVDYPENAFIEDTTNCTQEEIDKINNIKSGELKSENIDEDFKCITYKAFNAGEYNINITVGKDKYVTTLKVVDSEAPVLVAKDFDIYEDETYSVNDFVSSCTDNSQKDCKIDYLNTSLLDYSKYKDPGTYSIKIAAYDSVNNKSEPQTVTLTIKKIIYHTVSFNSNGGSSISSQQVREGQNISYPASPTKSNYIFEGWFYNNKEFDMTTPINSDITLTAKWKKIPVINPYPNQNYDPSPAPNPKPNACVKYKDAYADVSIYNYQLSGGSENDCMNKTSYLSQAQAIINKYDSELTEDYKEFELGGKFCSNINKASTTNVVRYNNFIVGYKMIVTATCDGGYKKVYEFHCSSKDKCDFY